MNTYLTCISTCKSTDAVCFTKCSADYANSFSLMEDDSDDDDDLSLVDYQKAYCKLKFFLNYLVSP